MRKKFWLIKIIFPLFLIMFINESYAHKTFIVTGFGPFGVYPINPTEIVVNLLPPYICMNGATECTDEFKIILIKTILPVSWNTAGNKLSTLINDYKADTQNPLIGVISLGASGDKGITLEQYAVNIEGGTDAEGVTKECVYPFINCPQIIEGGPFKLKISQNIKLKQVKAKIRSIYSNVGIKIGTSDKYNHFLCNLAFYTSLYFTQNSNIFAGFVHMQEPDKKLTAEQIAQAVTEYIKFVIKKESY